MLECVSKLNSKTRFDGRLWLKIISEMPAVTKSRRESFLLWSADPIWQATVGPKNLSFKQKCN